jgi:hypothetical protein
MIRFVGALCALVFVLTAVACESKSPQTDPSQAVEASVPSADSLMVAEVEKQFSDFKRFRDTSVGWAAEVRPGDQRDSRNVGDDLSKLSVMEKLLADAPNSDKVGNLRAGIRELMIEDSKLLLRKARSEQDIWALGQFVRHAQNLDVDLETDFDVKPADLRNEALVMAKKEVAEMRPRIREGSGDAIGGLQILYNEWQFTREELGLTVEEAKLLKQ